jgi:hypothetical protein
MDEKVCTKNFPYKLYCMPKVDGKHGYIQIVCTHAFSDGISLVSAWQAMTLKKDFSLLPYVSEPTVAKKVLNYLSAPIGMIRVMLYLLFSKTQKNCFKRDITGKRVVRISPDISMKAMKTQCKLNKCSLTEATLCILGQVLDEYAKNRGEKGLDRIALNSTFSHKGFPKRAEDVVLANNWMPVNNEMALD